MTDDSQLFAHLDALWGTRSLEIAAEIEAVRDHVQRVHYELGSMGDSICDALQDLAVLTEGVQRMLARGVVLAPAAMN